MNTKIKTLAASLLLAGCVPPLMCTEIGCLGGLSFGFEVDEPGTWTFELDLIEDATVIDTITCVGTLPLSDDADDGCDRSDAFLTLSGSELDPSQQSIAGLTLDNTTPEVVDDVLDALREIADGHALSESIRGRTATPAECEELAEGYTGAVFDFACRSGARVAGGDSSVIRSLGRYGRHAGMAWHMRDDLVAMEAHPDEVAATLDERLGRHSPNFAVSLGAERDELIGEMWMRLRMEQDDDLARELQERVTASGALSAGRERLLAQTWRARKALGNLAPSPHREALDRLAATIAK